MVAASVWWEGIFLVVAACSAFLWERLFSVDKVLLNKQCLVLGASGSV
jgi:hypothetical protein